MLDIGWTELLVVGIVALIVVGPKDLPQMFRTLGQMTAKARAMAREFQRAMDDAADASGVKDVAKDLRKATDVKGMGLDEVDKMRNWDPLKDDTKSKKGKTAASREDDDEAAFDAIEAEMARLRAERTRSKSAEGESAPATDKPAPKPATPRQKRSCRRSTPAA